MPKKKLSRGANSSMSSPAAIAVLGPEQIDTIAIRAEFVAALVEIGEDKVAYLKMLGHCGNCPMSQMTLKNGIQRLLLQEVPGVKEVVSVA